MKKSPTSNSSPNAPISRRTFLKVFGVAGATACASSVHPAEAQNLKPKEELMTVLDISKCIGCGECVAACTESNGHKYPTVRKPIPKMFPPRVKVEDWSDKKDVDDRLTPYNWLFIQTAEVEHNGETYDINIPRRCLHCTNPPCANLCPWGAARKEDTGIVRIHEDICLGGAKCRTVCPWHIPQRQSGAGPYLNLLPRFAGNGTMLKCDRCYDKIAQGEQPACITACPENVQRIGGRSEMIAYAKELAAATNGYIYGLEENGGTNTIYVSPVPFDKLNNSIDKGKGKPHLAPVENSMANEETLTSALIAAPIAGVAAGVLKVLSDARKEKNND
jgi:Fe-S-cluster-containing dehydrogenase component